MSAKRSKIPKSFANPIEYKTPKATQLPSDQCQPDIRADQMDHGGDWGWDKFESACMQELLTKIFEFQKLSWQDLKNSGSHFVRVGDLCSMAQKRLQVIKKEDLDELFSLRLTGRKRIWGIKEGNILWLLWWDPEHKVCSSPKKHT